MGQWRELVQDSKLKWDENAGFWDNYMGEESNQFHRELIRPYTETLLGFTDGQKILDIACGNGNFSKRLAELGADVVAFDYSSIMIERAKSRSEKYLNRIEYQVIDATDYDSLLTLGEQKYDSAVSNMALMDIADITPLIKALYKLLKSNGIFVFSITHPCFQTPGFRKINEIDGNLISKNSVQISKYLTPESYKSIAIKGQPISHLMFHRPLSYYLNLFFDSGFVLDGVKEPSFKKEKDNQNKFDWYEIPPVIIMRFRKI